MARRFGKQSMPPGLENTLNDLREVNIFKQFQSSPTINEILPGCDVKTEYQVEKCSWEVRSADYLKSLLVVWGDSAENSQGLQSWDSVLKLIQDAEDQYMEKGKRSWFRQKLRQGEDVASVLQVLTEAIPEEYGLGVLRGGLSMLFTAWRDRIKNREKIFSALSDIPTVLCVALQNGQFFQTDRQLWSAIKQLLGDAIDAIRSLIEILVPNSSSRAGLGSWRRRFTNSIPEHEARMIEQILAVVNSAMKNVETHLERLDRTRAEGIHIHAQSIDVKTGKIQETLNETIELVAAGNKRTDCLVESLAELRQGFHMLTMGGWALIPQQMELLGMKSNCHTSFYHLFGEEKYKNSLLPAAAVLGPVVQHNTTVLTTERLIQLMVIHSLSPLKDRDAVLRQGQTMSALFLGRGRYLFSMPHFQHLLSASSSGVLLVDGHCRDECDGKVSPLSVFCASLAATLAHNPALMVLHFFAGQHSYFDDDPARGPRGLMRSLICQVLLYQQQSLPCLEQISDQVVQDIADGDIKALCWLFKELLKRVVNVTTILCIVDNVSDFEERYEDWDKELNIVFDWFRSVPSELSPGVNLKLLMTSAGKSTDLVWKTHPSEHVSLVAGNVMNVGKSEWAMAQDIGESVPPQNTYWHEGPRY